MNNPTYFRFFEELSSRPSEKHQQHSTMYEPDFTNFDLSEISGNEFKDETADCEQHHETDLYYDEQGRIVQDTVYDNDENSQLPTEKRSNVCTQNLSHQPQILSANPSGYTWEDMNPIVRDPLCTTDSELAYFWPVYVSNFRCLDRKNEQDSVKKYFASKGFHVRWWFRQKGRYFNNFQTESGIYDMLVYFVSEYDATMAIKRCHRDTYNGYTLNVFPGRDPVYFDRRRSIQISKKGKGKVYSEQFFENHVKSVSPDAKITATVKFDVRRGAMEFESRNQRSMAVEKVYRFTVEPITGQQRKQRFLESEMLHAIELQLASDPTALQLVPGDKYVHMLMNGMIRPEANKKRTTENMKPKGLALVEWEIHQQQRIVKSLTQGKEPICYSTAKKNKTRFKRMVQKIKKRLERGEIIA